MKLSFVNCMRNFLNLTFLLDLRRKPFIQWRFAVSGIRKAVLIITLHLALVTVLFAQVDTAWVRRYNGTRNSDDRASAIAIDNLGNVYVTGRSYGSGTYNDYATIKYNSQGVQQWVQIYNGPENSDDHAYAIAVDDAGSVYVTGESKDDYCTIKYDQSGNEMWVSRYNGPGNYYDYATAIVVDDSGNVYITGSSYGGHNPVYDYATIKYNSQGVQQWVARYNGPDNFYDYAYAIAVDDLGNVYVTGNSSGLGTSRDYTTIKYDAQGTEEWVARYDGPANREDFAYAIAVDGSRNVYVTGYSKSISTWFDYATIKYNSQGSPEWVARYTGPGSREDYARAIAVDGSGNVYVTGLSHGGSNTTFDYATIKYNALGVQEWVARYNGPANREDYANAIAIDGSGNVYVTGNSFGTMDDYATVKYNNFGEQQWVARYNGPGNEVDCANGIAVDGSANVYVTGYSQGYGTDYDYTTIKYVQGLVHDVKTVRIIAPVGTMPLDTVITPQAEIKNVGNFTEDFPVIFRIGTGYEETLYVNLEPNVTTILSFPNWIASPIGYHIIKCSTALSNDNYPHNDAVIGNVLVAIDTGPVITQINPNYGGNIGNVRVDISGLRFCRDSLQETKVKLTRVGQPSLIAYTEVIDSTKIIAEFDLIGAEVGLWNVVVINPNGDSTIRYGGFRVLPGFEGIWMDFVGNDQIRIGRHDYYTVRIGNAGNVDAYGLAINIDIPEELQLTRITREDGLIMWDRDLIINNHEIGRALYPEYWIGAPPGITSSVIKYGDILWLPFLGRGQKVAFTMTVFAPAGLRDGQNLAPAAVILIGLGTAVGTSFAQHFIAQTIGARFGPDETRLPWLKALGRSFNRACKMTWEDWNPLNWFNWSTASAQEFFGQVADEDKPLGKIFQRYGMSAAKATETAEKLAVAGKNLKLAKINPILNLVLFGAQTSLESYEKLQYAEQELLRKEKLIRPVSSLDPNAKVGTTGYDSLLNFIVPYQPLNYTVFFENVDTATAEAETIFVTDRIDDNLDWNTLSLDTVSHPAVCTTLVDSMTRTITWWFRGINLPPNQNPPEGEGWCKFHIMPKPNLPSGTQIKNWASIVFDINPPIITDTILNTIDAEPPISSVRSLPETTYTGEFVVRWNGQDPMPGSGIKRYSVYVRVDSGPYQPIITGTSDTMATYIGTNEAWHYFYCIATDNVGWRENPPDIYDAKTFVNGIAPPIYLFPENNTFINDSTPIFAWSATAGTQGTYTLQYSTDSTFAQGVETITGLDSNSYEIPDNASLGDSLYFWRVEAVGRLGSHSGYRQPHRFWVDVHQPTSPVLLAPADSSILNSSTPTFIWSATANAGESYLLHYTTDSIIDSFVTLGVRTTDTSYTLPEWLGLNDTTYYWAVRTFDSAGNYSQFQDRPYRLTINARPDISGWTRYYTNHYPVESTSVILSGAMCDTVLTDSAGYYLLPNLLSLQNYIVAPQKSNDTREPAITANDAGLILKHCVRRVILDTLQKIAGNVSGDNLISAYDAGLVLQYSVGIIQHFPVGDWTFDPRFRTYDSLSSNQTDQNYLAILYGDANGSWPSSIMALAGMDKRPVNTFIVNLPKEKDVEDLITENTAGTEIKIEIPKRVRNDIINEILTTESPGKLEALFDNSLLVINPNATFDGKSNTVLADELPKTFTNSTELPSYQVIYPVEVKDIKGVYSADIQISYNPEKLRPIAIRTTDATRNFMVAGANYGGILRIGMASWQDLDGNVKLLEIVLEGKGEQLANPEIKVDWIILNDGKLIPTADGVMGKTEPGRLFSITCKPNPFASKVQIRYSIPKETKTTIRVFNSLGQAVKTLVNNYQKPNDYSITWDGSDDFGNKLANGIYFIRIATDDLKLDRKIVLLRSQGGGR